MLGLPTVMPWCKTAWASTGQNRQGHDPVSGCRKTKTRQQIGRTEVHVDVNPAKGPEPATCM